MNYDKKITKIEYDIAFNELFSIADLILSGEKVPKIDIMNFVFTIKFYIQQEYEKSVEIKKQKSSIKGELLW
jgi:hypothetical protein